MRYVIKNSVTGEYLGGESSWGRSWRKDINKAKLFHRASDARYHIERWGRWKVSENATVIGVVVSEAAQ